MKVSLDALIKLNEYLECKKVLTGEQSSDCISNLQKAIASEVISRLKQKTEDSGEFWEVIKSQLNAQNVKLEPLPFSWAIY